MRKIAYCIYIDINHNDNHQERHGTLTTRRQGAPESPTPAQLQGLRDSLESMVKVLNQVQTLHTYITKPYAMGRILDLSLSSQAPGIPEAER